MLISRCIKILNNKIYNYKKSVTIFNDNMILNVVSGILFTLIIILAFIVLSTSIVKGVINLRNIYYDDKAYNERQQSFQTWKQKMVMYDDIHERLDEIDVEMDILKSRFKTLYES